MTGSNDFAARLRRSYELGRLKHAAGKAWMVPLEVAISLWLCHRAPLTLAIGSALLLLAISLIWYGRTAATAARSGLRIGMAAFALPIITFQLGLPAWCDQQIALLVVNGGTGVGVGLLLSIESARMATKGVQFLLIASVVATLCAMLSCILFGVIGLAGVVAGALLSTKPVAIYRGATA